MKNEGHFSHLETLESEAIFIMREAVAEFEKPVLLFSGGKDSICLLKLAEKAFRPGRFPFPLLHIDTGHNFSEVIEFRDKIVKSLGESLIVRSVEAAIEQGFAVEKAGEISRNLLQIPILLKAIEEFKFDVAFGGARRDEEKARAKERIFSFRNEFGAWDPKGQRPELWNLFNTKIFSGEHMRVFPLSNWTEMDVWQYIYREAIEVPSIYMSHERDVIEREGQLLSVCDELFPLRDGESSQRRRIRFRTVGDKICTGAVESNASTVSEIINEIAIARETERGTRADDKRSWAAMEDRKRLGYF